MNRLRCAILLSALIVSVLSGCGGRAVDIENTGTRAVVIGIDSADWRIIEQLADDGDMPNLMSLRERGSWGPLETLNDIPLSPVIWTSIATGKAFLSAST